MPIVFVVTGVVLILTFFNVFNFKDNLTKREIIYFSLLIFLGYFVDNSEYGSYSFNTFHLIFLSIFLFVSIIKYKKTFLNAIIPSIIIAIIYYLYLLIDGLSIGTNLIIYFLIIIQLLANGNYIKGLVNFVLGYLFIMLIDIRYEVLEYSFVIIDLNLCFVGLIVYSLLFVICKLFAYLIFYKSVKFGDVYENKIFNSSIIIFNY